MVEVIEKPAAAPAVPPLDETIAKWLNAPDGVPSTAFATTRALAEIAIERAEYQLSEAQAAAFNPKVLDVTAPDRVRDLEHRLRRLRNAVEALSARERAAERRERCEAWELEVADLEARVVSTAQEVETNYPELCGKLAELLAHVEAINEEVRKVNARASYENLRSVASVQGTLKLDAKVFESVKLPALAANGTVAKDIWPPPRPNFAIQYAEMVSAICRGNPKDTRSYEERVRDDEQRKADETARMMEFYKKQEAGREALNAAAKAAAEQRRQMGGEPGW
jgi:hypothetical protein